MRGYRASRVLLTAVELDVFTAVGEGATSTEVAATLATHPRATESLLNALVALGALTKRADTFQNTPATARYLVAGSPECVRPGFLHSVNRWHTWATLSDCVRTGTCVLEPGIEQQEGNWTRAFIASTTPQAARGSAELVRALKSKNIRRMLDLGGGSGICSIALARAKPALRAEVFDLPIVVPLAQERIRRAGLEGRITTRSGDLRTDEFGSGYDLILVSAVCHLFGPDQNLDLLRRCYGALSPGGTLAIRDLILNSNRTSPAVAALSFHLELPASGASCHPFTC